MLNVNPSEREPEKYNVIYLKGKYQYHHTYPTISKKGKIVYSGPVEPMMTIWKDIFDILRKSSRIVTESRKKLKLLEERAKDFTYFKKNGITHIIVYRCFEK